MAGVGQRLGMLNAQQNTATALGCAKALAP